MKNFIVAAERFEIGEHDNANGFFITQSESREELIYRLKHKWIYDVITENPEMYPDLFKKIKDALQYKFQTPIEIDLDIIDDLINKEREIDCNDMPLNFSHFNDLLTHLNIKEVSTNFALEIKSVFKNGIFGYDHRETLINMPKQIVIREMDPTMNFGI